MDNLSEKKRIFVIGGTGFVGEAIVKELINKNFTPVLLLRDKSQDKIPIDIKDKIEVINGDIKNFELYEDILRRKSIDGIIYLLGIIREDRKGGITFKDFHYNYMLKTLYLAKKLNILRFIYMSANGAKANGTLYEKTKFEAEEYLKKTHFKYTIIRPSLIIGKSNKRNFMTLIDSMFKFRIGVIFGDGLYKISPVFLEDVAKVFVKCLEDESTINNTYTLCGSDEVSYNKFMKLCSNLSKKKILIIHIPFKLAFTLGKIGDIFYKFPFTSEQVKMICEGNTGYSKNIWKTLNLLPSNLKVILTKYHSK